MFILLLQRWFVISNNKVMRKHLAVFNKIKMEKKYDYDCSFINLKHILEN